MANFKEKKCIVDHPKMQSTIQYYNALSFTFKFYELQIHKAWYDNTEVILSYLSQPVLVKDPQTNRLKVNFNRTILELFKETVLMLKHSLGMWLSYG